MPQNRVGVDVRKSSNSREMVPFRKRQTHKLAGIESSNFDSKNISATVERSGCAGKVRQYKCSTVYSERRRDSLTPTMLQSMGIMAKCNRQQYTTESSTHSRTVEHFIGPVESRGYQTDRMGNERCGFAPDFSNMGQTISRSVCIISEPQNGNILFLGGSSSGIGNRRIDNTVEQNDCICIPTNMSDTQSTGTYEANSVQINIDSTAVAETSLVHCTASDVHCTTNTITTETRSVETTQDNNIPSQSGSVQPECMAAIDKQFGSKGLSKKVRELLSAS